MFWENTVMNILIERTPKFLRFFPCLILSQETTCVLHVLHVTLSCLVALWLACQSSFSSSFLFDFSRFSFSSNLIFPSSLFSVSDPCSDTWIEAWFVISISMLSSSISLLWPQLTHITHSSQIVGPTMGTLLHLSFISWLGKNPTHSDCPMYTFCSDSPNSQVLLRAP